MHKIKLLRITTETYSMHILLKGQLNFMSQKGLEVYMASTPDAHVPALEEQQNAKFFPLPLSRELTPVKDLIALYHTIRLIQKLKPQIVHTHSPKAGVVGMLAAFLCSVPVKIHTVAGLPLMEVTGAKRKLLNFVESFTYWCADWVLPNSQELKKFILDHDFTRPSKVKVMGNGSSNGMDLAYFSITQDLLAEGEAFRQEHGITEEHTILTFMGRLAFYKGINELVEAFQILQKKYSNLKLLLIGAPEELNPLKESTKNEVINNKDIISVGHQIDVRKFLAVSDIFVFPSYREGFPQALMQASAMGLPSVATNINGCNEILENGKTGILIEPKSVEAIVDAASQLLDDEQGRIIMAKAAQNFITTNFEQKKLWQMIYDFYVDCVGKTGLK
ncbi:glycosyltransferase family 4 protein [Dyadobacter bucti]|uniref:glycosyltransferase family 4 protein n=1 Tax=Dyadobacter bucti TaxID=2572203 RepID=UPI001107E02E|nr:glycosyltransferase family 4 protein [Dyadobacter bucti]